MSSSDNTIKGWLIATFIIGGLTILLLGTKNQSIKNPDQGAGENGPEKSLYSILGQDPWAFADAQALYALGPAIKIPEDQADKLMTEFNKRRALPENPACRQILLELEKAPDFKLLLERIEETLSLSAKSIGQPLDNIPADAKSVFKRANASYKGGRFNEAIDSYISLLAKYPNHTDARNNIGLAEMHLGHNLIALMHFKIILKSMPSYSGAKQNASVALERLGLSEDAYKSAKGLAKDAPGSVMAQYNLGWFQNAHGEYIKAGSSFKDALDLYPSHSRTRSANVLNIIESGEKPSAEDLSYLNKNLRDMLRKLKIMIVEIRDINIIKWNIKDYFKKIIGINRYLLSEKNGNWIAVYSMEDNVKKRIWLNGNQNGISVKPYQPAKVIESVKRISRMAPPAGMDLWWWFAGIVLILQIFLTRRAYKNSEAPMGKWGIISIALFIILAGFIYPFVFPYAQLFGILLILGYLINIIILFKAGSY